MFDSAGSLILLAVFLLISFFLSGMEAGVYALSRMRVRKMMKADNQKAKLLNEYLDDPEDFIWTILVGNTLASFLAASLVVLKLMDLWTVQPVLFFAALVMITLAYYVFIDLLPKMLFRQFPNRLCMMFIRPFRFVHLTLQPLVFLVSWFAEMLVQLTGGRTFTGNLFGDRNELRLLMQESSQVLSNEEKVIINRVLDMENLTVRSCCRTLDKISTVSANTTLDEALRIFRDTGSNRLPVWRIIGGRTRIIGYLYLFPLLFAEKLDRSEKVSAHARPVLHMREHTRLKDALRIMQESGERLAVVTDRNEKEKGILTLQDILRTIFGELNL